jgi:dipeptidyl-peptidase 4
LVPGDFNETSFSGQWLDDGCYVTVERAEEGQEIVAWDADSGQRTVLVAASQLTPDGQSKPLAIDGFDFSSDRSLVLIYTNSQQVWRRKTRGDYWVLDRSAGALHQLGGDARPASLMFAKLSPTGTHAAYVRENNLYLEDLRSREIVPLTTDGSADVINGTFDWVHEEEFGLRDGFRWSPDGAAIAYWQLDTTGVPEFVMIDHISELYPQLRQFKYPKAGQQNASSRLGVVTLADRQTRWMDIPGHSRDHYLPRMQWAGDSAHLLIQHMNRLQNTNDVLRADVASGQVTTAIPRAGRGMGGGSRRVVLDGRRPAFHVDQRAGRLASCVSDVLDGAGSAGDRGDWDVIELLRADAERDEMYFVASPDNPTQRYLYRARLDGSQLQRVTPEDRPGMHRYEISPDGSWAIHRWSSLRHAAAGPVGAVARAPDGARTGRQPETGRTVRIAGIATRGVLPCRDRRRRVSGRVTV